MLLSFPSTFRNDVVKGKLTRFKTFSAIGTLEGISKKNILLAKWRVSKIPLDILAASNHGGDRVISSVAIPNRITLVEIKHADPAVHPQHNGPLPANDCEGAVVRVQYQHSIVAVFHRV
jgi:hypothetical protein